MAQKTTITSNNNPILSDYLVTQKVNPDELPDARLIKDLELLKKAEVVMGHENGDGIEKKLDEAIVPEKRYETLQEQAMDALTIQNPFKGA